MNWNLNALHGHTANRVIDQRQKTVTATGDVKPSFITSIPVKSTPPLNAPSSAPAINKTAVVSTLLNLSGHFFKDMP